MQHWLVYHSTRTTGRSYRSFGESAVFSTKERPKLCLNDVIWVVEGPEQYALVDCFRYEETGYPPFPAPFSDFKLKIQGSLPGLSSELLLKTEWDWVSELRKMYLSKQRFFERIDGALVDDLLTVSGVTL